MRDVDKSPSNYVDLIYLDPPFNSKRAYNTFFKDPTGKAHAQAKAFDDTWTWNDQNKYSVYQKLTGMDEFKDSVTYQRTKKYAPKIPDVIQSFHNILGRNNMMAYLIMMTPRLIEMKRILKETGSIYLHCDPTASHYLKIIMDNIFGIKKFQNEIIWHYGLGSSNRKTGFLKKHDVILFYGKSSKINFNLQRGKITPQMEAKYCHSDNNGKYMISYGKKYYLKGGKPFDDVWDIPTLSATHKERTGYPTQKPLALLERIIKASSNPGDIVFDPFCGCATANIASGMLNRKWIGIDITYLSVGMLEKRLRRKYEEHREKGKKTNLGFKRGEAYIVEGRPESVYSAKMLFEDRGGHEFANWIITDMGGLSNTKKSGDNEVDGYYHYDYDIKGKVKTAIIQVKGGGVTPSMVRAFCNTVNNLDKPGLFAAFNENITQGMKSIMSEAGTFKDKFNRKKPKVQFVSVSDVINRKPINL